VVAVTRRTVSIADDERGRVPFAVVGVLLLVSSLALATTLRPEPAPTDTAVERAMAEMTAISQTAVRDGVATASQRAAADPVVDPADTALGRALNDSAPFRSALRLRIYLQVRDRLGRLSASGGDGVDATASLPAVTTTSGYEDAIDRVHIEQAGANNTSVQATVENVTLTARRGGEVVTRRTVTQTVVVPTPVLYVHERVETYETRLNNSLARPGLSQRTTARLYPIVWARGYAQYGGAPIENVVANRHVSLATNGAMLGVQRSVFGRSDPEGRQALGEATAAVGIDDLAAGRTNGALVSTVLSRVNYGPASQNISTADIDADVPRANESVRIGVNGTADAAFAAVAGPLTIASTAREAYTVDVRTVTERERLSGGPPDRPDPPVGNWTFLREETTTRTTVVSNLSERPSMPSGWHTLDQFGRVVEVTYEHDVTWRNPESRERETTTATGTARYLATGRLLCRHSNGSVAPVRGISTAHTRGAGPLDGPNLAGVETMAEATLLDNESHDSVAQAVAVGAFTDATTTVTGDRPESIDTWLYRDLQSLRETVRDLNTTVERGSVGTFETNPAERLDQLLEERRDELVAAPETYNSTAQRARIAARIDYLDAVSARLTNQSESHSAAETNLSTRLRNATDLSLTELRRGLSARGTVTPQTEPTPTGPAGPVETRIDAQPQYLTLASVDQSQVPAVDDTEHPLVARNTNVFSIPYGNAASVVMNAGTSGVNRARLATAAATLQAANGTNLSEPNATLEADRAALADSVADANAHVEGALSERVAVQTSANSTVATGIVEAALDEWVTTADRGMAIANNSASGTIAAVAAERENLSAVEEDWLAVRLTRTATVALATAGARPPTSVVNQTANTVRSVARTRVQSAIENRTTAEIQDIAQRRFGRRVLPSGLPVAPPFTPWYFTVNIWTMTVEGEYARFAVSARHGTTGTGPNTMTYAREDEWVTLDADGDGEPETLGSNDRLSFDFHTGVVVVVPPEPRGVGDKDGNSVETSSGWPAPG